MIVLYFKILQILINDFDKALKGDLLYFKVLQREVQFEIQILHTYSILPSSKKKSIYNRMGVVKKTIGWDTTYRITDLDRLLSMDILSNSRFFF